MALILSLRLKKQSVRLKKTFEQAFLEIKLNVLYKLVQTFPSPWDEILSCMDNPKAITGAEIPNWNFRI